LVKDLFKKLKKILPFIGLFIFIYTIYSLDIFKIIESFLAINPLYIIISLSLTLPRVLIRNFVWRMIQDKHNIKLSFIQSLKIFLIGYFYGSFTPGYMGQLIRVPYMKEKTSEPYGKLFINSILETIVHSISLFAMILIGAFLVLGTFPQLFFIIIIWLIIMTFILLFFINKNRGEKLFYILISYLIPRRYKTIFYRFINTFYNDFPKVKTLILPVILGVVTWVIIFSQEYILVIALNLDIPYLFFLLLFPIANVVGFIPITFAGLGTRELTAVFIFSTLFMVSGSEIFVVSLLGFIITDIFTGFIGFLLSLSEAKISIKF
jgi:uncharacterized protein (TIRG00374 family)